MPGLSGSRCSLMSSNLTEIPFLISVFTHAGGLAAASWSNDQLQIKIYIDYLKLSFSISESEVSTVGSESTQVDYE